MSYYNNKIVVLTGAGSGMGRDMAIQLAVGGARVLMSDINEAGLDETTGLIRSARADIADAHVLDVADREAVFAYASKMIEQFDRIDVVINNAGLSGPDVDFLNSDIEVYDKVLGVNLGGVINCTHAFLPALHKNPGSHLVNISSIFGLIAPPRTGAYVISKFAVRGYTEALITELAPVIKVTCVHPGVIATNIVKSSGANQETIDLFERAGMPSDRAAQIILRGVAKGKKRVLVTKGAWVVDIAQRLMPTGYRPFLPTV